MNRTKLQFLLLVISRSLCSPMLKYSAASVRVRLDFSQMGTCLGLLWSNDTSFLFFGLCRYNNADRFRSAHFPGAAQTAFGIGITGIPPPPLRAGSFKEYHYPLSCSSHILTAECYCPVRNRSPPYFPHSQRQRKKSASAGVSWRTGNQLPKQLSYSGCFPMNGLRSVICQSSVRRLGILKTFSY